MAMDADNLTAESVDEEELPTRLMFGTDAYRYDTYRPSYHPDLFAWLADEFRINGDAIVLELGAGTGIASTQMLYYGPEMHLVEPSAPMAAILETKLDPDVPTTIFPEDFESVDLEDSSYDLVIAAQSWHWLTPGLRSSKVARLLRKGGGLAVFWNVGEVVNRRTGIALRRIFDEFDESKRSNDPDRHVIYGSLLLDDYFDELSLSGHFGHIERKFFTRDIDCPLEDLINLISSMSDFIRLDAAAQRRIVARLHRSFGRRVEPIELRMETHAIVAWT
jgi:SAM-dependent methyltransferase